MGIGRRTPTQPAPRVAFTGEQGIGKTRGFAKRVAALQQTHHGRRAELATAVDIAVLARHHIGQLPAIGGHAPAFADDFRQAGAGRLVANVARQHIGSCHTFAQVVAQAGKAHSQRRVQLRRHVQHHQQVNASVNFRVVRGGLRHAPELVDFRQQPVQRTAVFEHRQHARRLRFHQPARQLLPDAFGHQRIGFAVGHHLLHQRHGFRRDRKVMEPGGEPRQPQNAHRVFGEGWGDVAQHPLAQVVLAAAGIDQMG